MDVTEANWRKSTKSSGNGGDCVEVADNLPHVLVRDTHQDPLTPSNPSPAPTDPLVDHEVSDNFSAPRAR
ncbi:DUF397 domain-containing protein [Micromonospora sp. NBC_01796]|uniref:DUF397 domain-containing protein n=1 Tax=Micromonospora sp. NBC_01796 TaxID=2975987 RepID=UPI002DD934D2|nr:DUF397 domain-containing protein [Micromonospora sp. NBC_01796]WSA88740.1 DUF397 domain-containing protein [Micromonospora sp. NBC_01796]